MLRFKCVYIITALLISTVSLAQTEQKISSMDFVQILNNNTAEAMHYYENNWKALRIKAVENNFIESYQILKTDYSEESPFHLILVTTYKNETQFNKREKHFQNLIDNMGDLNLLNNKKPLEFRKVQFGTDAKHLN